MKTQPNESGKGYFVAFLVIAIIVGLILFFGSCDPIDQGPSIITDSDTLIIVIR